MNVSAYLIDAGVFVALLDGDDVHHRWAAQTFDALHAPLLTCEAVLSEAWFLLRRGGGRAELLVDALILIGVEVIPTWPFDAARFLKRYADRTSMADASLLALAEADVGRVVVTTDRQDFTVYRIHGRKAVPALVPPV